LSFLLYQTQVYVGQFESLATRWAQGDFEELQPSTPGLNLVLMMLFMEMLKVVGAKEVCGPPATIPCTQFIVLPWPRKQNPTAITPCGPSDGAGRG
jgi:hypothetical protein